jgi:predicted alpha/beta-fold hydrolase
MGSREPGKSIPMVAQTYCPSWWLPGPHARTIWGRFFRRTPPLGTRVERWDTPDGDFIDLVRLEAAPGRPHLVILHGLEGTPRSHYARGLFLEAARRGWSADLLLFRGCGEELNRAPRFYHSGETGDLDTVAHRLLEADPAAPFVFAGVSLGGNVLLKWLGELGASRPARVIAAAAVSVPFDLARASRHIGHGFARVYQRHFLQSLRRKALAKLERFPGLVPRERIESARTLYDFDDAVTAPVHGFSSADDYYSRSSSIRFLPMIRVRTLLLNAIDDPFLPSDVLNEVKRVAQSNSCIEIEFPASGGHVGFVSGRNPLRPFYYAEWRVAEFLERAVAAAYDPAVGALRSGAP